MNFINFLIIKFLVNTKYANIINIAAKKEILPELLQSNCNAENIFKVVNEYLESPQKIEEQINETNIVLNKFRTDRSSTELASQSLNKFL